MEARWRVLVLLFLIKGTMAFQFGSAGALGQAIAEDFRVDAIGFLVGLYLSPGLLFALPGGAMARAVGDRRAVLGGLALMAVGGCISALSSTWEAQLAGRAVRRRPPERAACEDGHQLVCRPRDRHSHGALRQFLAGGDRARADGPAPHRGVGGLPAAFGLTAILAVAVSVPLLWRSHGSIRRPPGMRGPRSPACRTPLSSTTRRMASR